MNGKHEETGNTRPSGIFVTTSRNTVLQAQLEGQEGNNALERLLRECRSHGDEGKATAHADEILCSMSHGAGRKMSRSDCKPLADSFDFVALRRNLLLPSDLDNTSLRTEGPYAYRELEECLALIRNYVEEIIRFGVIAYMGHL
jgi:hypothetical protein